MKILVIDPEAEVRLLFFIASDELHCEPFFASSGEEAFDIWFDHDDIGVVLLSTDLPDIDARDLADRLRKTERGHHSALVFLSHTEDSSRLVELLKYGDDVVIKPFSQAVLLAKLLAMQRTRMLYQRIDEHNRELEQFRAQTEAEIQIASDVFSYINAQNLPAVPGVTTFLSAYSSFSGDLLLMAARPGEGFNVLIADITGHGLPAALGTIPIAETFFTMTQKGFGVGDIAREMNKVFRKRMPDYLLCAAILIAVQDEGTRLQIWSGGMPPCLVYGIEGKVTDILRSQHMAIGALTNAEFDDGVSNIELARGQQILCFTDGVTETTNENGEMFGETGFIDALEGPAELNLVERIINNLYPFVEDSKLSDDITLFCFNNTEYTQVQTLGTHTEESYNVNGFHWSTHFRLEPAQLRNESPLELIFSALPQHPIIRGARADLSFVINELFVNALDHGVLRLDSALKEQEDGLSEYFMERAARLADLSSGFVEIEISCDVDDNLGNFCIACKDSGPGFDFAAMLSRAGNESHHSGRGLSTVAAMCNDLRANAAGNIITAHYQWQRSVPIEN
ncbi:MAG TPA: SpoIIE family protein phosphatase [Spongiibacteraceae bacterium]|nr:SpoIIE family protein phosphatase [Spongiibacteraceae bacterium]